jgi:hypothetical protein
MNIAVMFSEVNTSLPDAADSLQPRLMQAFLMVMFYVRRHG